MENKPSCLYCGKQDNETPLVLLTFKGKSLWICSTHLPLLIHEPEKLEVQLADAVKRD